MDLVSVRCNHCGAPLEVGETTRYVACQFCACSLEVKRTESSVFTEEVAKIADNTGKMAASLEVIELQNEIERLDREWGMNQPRSPEDAGKSTGLPGSIFGFVFAVIFAFACFVLATKVDSFGAPGVVALLPVGMGILAIVVAISRVAQSNKLEENKLEYQERRQELERQLARVKRG